MNVLVLDIETNGKGTFRPPTQRPIEIAWAVCSCSGEVLKRQQVFVSGVERIAPKAQKIHGYSTTFINKEGVSMKEAYNRIEKDLDGVGLIVGHNIEFDIGCLEYHNNILKETETSISGFLNKLLSLPTFCTMRQGTKICKIPLSRGGYKWPKLCELAEFSEVAVDKSKLHGAVYDVELTLKSYFKLWGKTNSETHKTSKAILNTTDDTSYREKDSSPSDEFIQTIDDLF